MWRRGYNLITTFDAQTTYLQCSFHVDSDSVRFAHRLLDGNPALDGQTISAIPHFRRRLIPASYTVLSVTAGQTDNMTQPLRPDKRGLPPLSDPTPRLPFLPDGPHPRRFRADHTRSRTDGTLFASDYGPRAALNYGAPIMSEVIRRPIMPIMVRPIIIGIEAHGWWTLRNLPYLALGERCPDSACARSPTQDRFGNGRAILGPET